MNVTFRLVWLIDTLISRKSLSFEEISDLWSRNTFLNNGSRLPRSTFSDWVREIRDLFGIRIEYDRSNLQKYVITNPDEMRDNTTANWIINSISVCNTLSQYKDMKDRIIIENIPSGQPHLDTIINAMRDCHPIQIEYHNFRRDDHKLHTLQPSFVKLFERRWYVSAFSVENNEQRVYSLDRIKSITVLTDSSYTYDPKVQSHEAIYDRCTGIFTSDNKPVEIVFRTSKLQAKYLTSLPLHQSQKIVRQTQIKTTFSITVAPTIDLNRKFLSLGANVEIISPEWYRQEIREECARMAKMYKILR